MSLAEEYVLKYRANPRYFIERYLHIETEEGRVKALLPGKDVRPIRGKIYPFYFSEEQQIVYSVYQRQRKERRPVRILFLKGRQICSSTFWVSLVFVHSILNPNTKAFIVANLDNIKEQLYRKIELFYNDLPFPLKPTVKQFSLTKGIYFDNEKGTGLRSEINFAVSANKDAGAGSSRNWFLGTEIARWFFPEEIMLSVTPAIPNEPETFIILESTAHGHGNYFHNLWNASKNGETEFEPIFIPWFKHKYYKLELDKKWTKIPLDTEDRYKPEKELKKRFGLTDEQLYWRRWAIDNRCNGNPLAFCQEYPSTDIEAFISTSRNVFDVRKLQQLYLLCEKGEKGDIRNNQFISTYDGYWTIWQPPQPNIVYIFGVDSGTGLEDGDPNAIVVLRADTLDQVAEFHSNQNATDYSNSIIEGAKYYNNAFLVIEATGGSGIAVLERVKEKYNNLYLWERLDEYGKVITKKLGFETNRNTKPLLIQEIEDYITFDYGKIRSEKLIAELMVYVEKDTNTGRIRTGADINYYDDRVMAFGLALRGRRSNQRRWEKQLQVKVEHPKVEYTYNVKEQYIEIPFKRQFTHQEENKTIITPYGAF